MSATGSSTRFRLAALAILAAVAAGVAAGCSGPAGSPGTPAPASANLPDVGVAGDIPDTQVFVEVTSFDGCALRVPEGWASTTRGTATTFTDKLNSITVDSRTGATEPTEAGVQQEVELLGSTAPGYTAGTIGTVTRSAGPAVRATYRIDSTADSVTGKTVTDEVERYEFFRDGHLVTITLAAPVGADNVDPWRTVTDSFRWTP